MESTFLRSHAAASDLRSGNIPRTLRRTSCAMLAPHKKPQTDAHRLQLLLRQRWPLSWRVRTQPTGRPTPLRNRRTSVIGDRGRNLPPTTALAGLPEHAYRLLSTQSPKPSAEQQHNAEQTE